jgi:hypothetical protein
MENMNWGVWIRGVISALSAGAITALAALATMNEWPPMWKLFVIGGIPTLLNFFSYIKQSPPPFGYKVVRDLSIPLPTCDPKPPEPPKP